MRRRARTVAPLPFRLRVIRRILLFLLASGDRPRSLFAVRRRQSSAALPSPRLF